MTDRADSERYVNLARRWFSEGWARNIALADGLFSENVRTNGVLVGKANLNAGYKSGWRASRSHPGQRRYVLSSR